MPFLQAFLGSLSSVTDPFGQSQVYFSLFKTLVDFSSQDLQIILFCSQVLQVRSHYSHSFFSFPKKPSLQVRQSFPFLKVAPGPEQVLQLLLHGVHLRVSLSPYYLASHFATHFLFFSSK